MRAWRRRWHLVSPTLYIIIVYRVNLNKLSRNFVGAIRTTTTNCRVSFIDLYLVFPTNFRMVFLPLYKLCKFTRTVLWYYHRAWVTCVNTRGVVRIRDSYVSNSPNPSIVYIRLCKYRKKVFYCFFR